MARGEAFRIGFGFMLPDASLNVCRRANIDRSVLMVHDHVNVTLTHKFSLKDWFRFHKSEF